MLEKVTISEGGSINTSLPSQPEIIRAIAFAILVALPFMMQGQTAIPLQSGTLVLSEDVFELDIRGEETADGQLFRVAWFDQIPVAPRRQELERSGWAFLRYLGKRAYMVSIPAGTNSVPDGVRAIVALKPELKIHPQVLDPSLPEWAVSEGGKTIVHIIGHKSVLPATALESLTTLQITPTFSYPRLAFFRAELTADQISQVAALPWVEWMELTTPPSVPDDDPARALHRSGMLDAAMPNGLHFTGAGVRTLVRDDGRLPVHPDFKGRLVDFGNDEDFFFGGGTHGDQVAGVIGGAGNINPRFRGMATGAILYNLNYEAEFTDTTLDLHLNDNVVITNSSYSNGCTSGYNFGAFNVDLQLFENPTLMHVFSAGNSNGSNCGYGAGNQWANVTGGHKIAKNCITVANLLADATLVTSSSRGPSSDGRLKPDLAANGQDQITAYPDDTYEAFGGTSAAAPGVAGVMAQLYEAYRTLHAQDPPAALIKALMLNTATDLGNPGPDYKYGWGHVNAWRAWQGLEAGSWMTDQAEHQDTVTFSIAIPDNLASARVMLYWPEPPASVATEEVLINDLDLTASGPDGSQYKPLVLRHEPQASLLDANAVPGRDSMNNVEQIFLSNPEPGIYTFAVSGTEIPLGPQSFFLTWHFDHAQEIAVTWPHGGESFIPGTSPEYIHWEAAGNEGDFLIEYSPDSGTTWQMVDEVSGTTRIYAWTVPESVTGKGLIRVSRDGVSGQSVAPFSIASPPSGLRPVTVCPDSMVWEWQPVDEATSYTFFKLGASYMDSIGHPADTLFAMASTFPYQPSKQDWVAVSMEGVNGLKSLRSIAVPFATNDLLNCQTARDLSLKGFVSPASGNLSLCEPFDEGLTMVLVNTGFAPASGIEFSYRLNEEPVVTELFSDTLYPGDTLFFQFTTPEQIVVGVDSMITGWVQWGEDEFPYNDTIPSYRFTTFIYGPSYAIPFLEQFSDADVELPAQWRILNPDDQLTWTPRTVTQSDGSSGVVMFVDNYAYSTAGEEEDYLLSPKILLPDSGNLRLSFDYAYAYYNDVFWDKMRIDVSTDCGNSFPFVVFEKEKDELSTAPPVQGSFSPQQDDWERVFIDMTPFAGEEVIVRFVNISGYGNQMYLDNINVSTLTQPIAGFGPPTGQLCAETPIELTDASTGGFLAYSWMLPAGISIQQQTPDEDGLWQLTAQESGIFEITLVVTNPLGTDTTTVVLDIAPQPAPAFDYQIDGQQVSFMNSSVYADSYLWEFGDGQQSDLAEPVHTYASPGTYTVLLTATNSCGDRTVQSEIETVTSTNTPNAQPSMTLSPNPATDRFMVTVSGLTITSGLTATLSDLNGKALDIPIRTTPSSSDSCTIEVETKLLPAGMYVISVSTEDGILTRRVSVVGGG